MTTLIEYNKEIAPMIRSLQDKKDELKVYKDGNEEFQVLQEDVKAAQKELAIALEKDDNVKQMTEGIKELSKEIQQAVKSASKGSGFKPKQLKDYFFARQKEDAVPKAVSKGKLFDALNEEIDG